VKRCSYRHEFVSALFRLKAETTGFAKLRQAHGEPPTATANKNSFVGAMKTFAPAQGVPLIAFERGNAKTMWSPTIAPVGR
jgi:hypothetical protein